MNRKDKLAKIVILLDYIAKLNNFFWIDKWNLISICVILSTIDDEKYFNNAYKIIIAEISWIMNNILILDNKINKIHLNLDEKVNNIEEQVIEWSQKIADSINTNIKSRKLTIDNLRISNDKLIN